MMVVRSVRAGLAALLWRARFAACALLAVAVTACVTESRLVEPPVPDPVSPADSNPDWTTLTHGNTSPDYAEVFPNDEVPRLDLAMSREQWAAIQADVSSLFGFSFGAGGSPSQTFPTDDPAYVNVALRFGGKRWDHVGFRLKGNSSLAAAWRGGKFKLPFRLKLDQFAKDFPRIRGQRFYGFRELSFSPAVADASLIRERLASELLRASGVGAARTAFYRVWVDFGGGSRYVGLYTAVEVIDDTYPLSAFGEDDGNLYKPTSTLETFRADEFEKKSNKSAADFSDVQALVTALNDPLRSAQPAAWRSALEATFDVDHFLRWLAVNTTMVNWDAYGTMAQNYYLYRHSTRGLVWIPWDHNESFTNNPPIVGVQPTFNGLSFTMNEVGAQWPLIRFLIDDPVYDARYRELLRELRETVFTEAVMHPLIDRLHAQVAPWAIGESGEFPSATFLPDAAAFTGARPVLRAHASARRALSAAFAP
ncbi:MAG: CotH kinase family protein [Gemmatimonadaceae bacterium]